MSRYGLKCERTNIGKRNTNIVFHTEVLVVSTAMRNDEITSRLFSIFIETKLRNWRKKNFDSKTVN